MRDTLPLRLATFSIFSILLPTAFAQSVVSATSSLDANGRAAYQVKILFTPKPFPDPPITGAPYSADELVEATRRDGSTVDSGEPMRRHYRDSQGRTRVERALYIGPNMPQTPRIIEICDVVSGYSYTLDPLNKIAYRARRPQPGAAPAQSAVKAPAVATTGSSQPDVSPSAPTVEVLPSRTIEGLPVQGTRYTNIIPTYGPDARPVTTYSEIWFSKELRQALSTRVVDAHNGQRITLLKNISRAEPAAELFAVPPGYTVRAEPGRFTMEFTLQ